MGYIQSERERDTDRVRDRERRAYGERLIIAAALTVKHETDIQRFAIAVVPPIFSLGEVMWERGPKT